MNYVLELCISCGADATVYVGGLDEKVTESLLWELFLQAGPIGNELVQIAKWDNYVLHTIW